MDTDRPHIDTVFRKMKIVHMLLNDVWAWQRARRDREGGKGGGVNSCLNDREQATAFMSLSILSVLINQVKSRMENAESNLNKNHLN